MIMMIMILVIMMINYDDDHGIDKVKTGRRKPIVYTSVGAIKEDLTETERPFDLVHGERLERSRNIPFEQKRGD